jgi:hypothetical protein
MILISGNGISYLPWENSLQILKNLVERVAQGGFILLEEITSIAALKCDPPHPGYTDLRKAASRQFAIQNSPPAPGLDLLHYLNENQYKIAYSTYQPALRSERERMLLTLGVHSAKDKLIATGEYTQEKIEAMLYQLDGLSTHPGYLPYYNEMSQITLFK